MPKLNGVFDNRETMQREAWIDGEVAALWPSLACEDMAQTMLPWERKVLEKPWGHYPDPPHAAIR
jgi:hypothetical protein